MIFSRYEGALCDENIDECSTLAPCFNGATCYDLYGDYDCACMPGYGGKHCEVVSPDIIFVQDLFTVTVYMRNYIDLWIK